MARAVELGVTLRDVFFEGAEERGKNLIFILLGGGVDLTAEESEVVGIAVDDAHDAADEFGREAFAGLEHGEDGDPECEFLDLFELAAERFGGGHHGSGNRREVGALEVDDRAFGAEGVAGFVGGGDKELTHFVILTEKFGFGAWRNSGCMSPWQSCAITRKVELWFPNLFSSRTRRFRRPSKRSGRTGGRDDRREGSAGRCRFHEQGATGPSKTFERKRLGEESGTLREKKAVGQRHGARPKKATARPRGGGLNCVGGEARKVETGSEREAHQMTCPAHAHVT